MPNSATCGDAVRRMRGETRRKARRCIRRRSVAARIAAKTAGAEPQGAGERPSPRAPRRTPEGAMRGLLRRRQRGGTRENETSRAGLRPDGVYVYAERSQGRANRPFLAGEHRCGEASRTMSGKPTRHAFSYDGGLCEGGKRISKVVPALGVERQSMSPL